MKCQSFLNAIRPMPESTMDEHAATYSPQGARGLYLARGPRPSPPVLEKRLASPVSWQVAGEVPPPAGEAGHSPPGLGVAGGQRCLGGGQLPPAHLHGLGPPLATEEEDQPGLCHLPLCGRLPLQETVRGWCHLQEIPRAKRCPNDGEKATGLGFQVRGTTVQGNVHSLNGVPMMGKRGPSPDPPSIGEVYSMDVRYEG